MPATADAPVSRLPWRQTLRRFLAFVALLPAAACGPAGEPQIRVVDLLARFGAADARPHGARFELAFPAVAGESRPGIVAPAASRITWTLAPLPRRATLRASLGVPVEAGPGRVAVRVGISDGRTYETLAEHTVSTEDAAAAWRPLEVDLSKYAGPQWSLFYRPDTRRWEVILATTVLEGAPTVVYWANPGIDTDHAAARLYQKRRPDAGR